MPREFFRVKTNETRLSVLLALAAVMALLVTGLSFAVETAPKTSAASRSYGYDSYTSGSTWTVPYGVSSITVAAYGGAAGRGGTDGYAYGNGGVWGYVAATIAVTAGDVIGVYPGNSGTNGNGCVTGTGGGSGGADSYAAANYNGGNGGNAGTAGCSGGGGGGGAASIVTKNSDIQLIAAGAGGGAGANNRSNAPSGYTGSTLASATYGWSGGNGWDCSESDDGGGSGGGGGGYRGGYGGVTSNGGGECQGGAGSAGSNFVIAGASSVTNTTASSSAETITITYSATSVSTPVLASGSDTGLSNSDSITSATSLVFSGTATGGSSVQLKTGGVNTGSTCTADTSTGAWTCTTGTLAAGTHSITAAATIDGQTVASSAVIVSVDTSAPTPSITTASVAPPVDVSVQSSETGTAYLVNSSVSVSNVASITSAADASWNSVSVATANSATAMSTSGLSDGTYKVYTVDVAGNLSAASVGTLTLDSVAPTASLGAVTIPNTSLVTVQSSETGTAYLVNSSVSVSNLASITGADGKYWNSVAITQVATNTSLSASGLVEGSYSAYAVDAAGNLSAASSNSASITLTYQAVFSITNAPLTLAYNGTVTVGTSGGSGTGAIAFATTSPAICSVNAGSGIVTMLASTGTCGIAATKAADDVYYATSANVNIDAVKATQAALSVSGSASASYGSTVQLSTSGGSTSGNVTWSHGSSTACTVSSSGLVSVTSGTGTCSVTASMAGNTNYEPVTSSAHVVAVSKATQSALTVTTTEATYGETLNLSVTGGSGTGALTWTKISGTCSVAGAELTPGNAGDSCVVKVTKAADGNYLVRSSADTSIVTEKAAQTGFSITSASTFVTGTPLTLSASGGQTGAAVTWSVVSGSCSISSGRLNAARGGITCVVSASKAGDSNYLSVSASQSVSVDKIAQTLSITSTPPSPTLVGSTYTVVVSSDAFLAAVVAVAQQSQSVCSVLAEVVTFRSTGTCVISASQSGNDVYAAAAASQSVTVTAAPVTTTTVTTQPGSGDISTTTVPRTVTSTTAPRVVVTTTSTTTTTTTTTTVPADPSRPQMGVDGVVPELKAGQTMALVRGQLVEAQVTIENGVAIISLPNDVQVRIGSSQVGDSAQVSPDGVLRMSRREDVSVEMSGLVPGTTYTVFMFSDPVELGRGVATDAGAIEGLFETPPDAAYGAHTLQVNGVGPGGEIVSLSMGFEVLEHQSNVLAVVLALGTAVLLALLGGKPIFSRRRRRA